MTTPRALALLALLFSSPACKGGDPSGGGEAAGGGYEYDCRVFLAPAAASDEPITGAGTAADEAAATEAAWTEACGKLPADQQASCRDESAWKASKTVSTGSDSVTVGIALTPATSDQVSARAVSKVDEATACKDALLAACKEAGAEGDCVAAGTHVKKGEASGKTLVR